MIRSLSFSFFIISLSFFPPLINPKRCDGSIDEEWEGKTKNKKKKKKKKKNEETTVMIIVNHSKITLKRKKKSNIK